MGIKKPLQAHDDERLRQYSEDSGPYLLHLYVGLFLSIVHLMSFFLLSLLVTEKSTLGL